MLVSHRKGFIYTKTVKTASTSLELYFEPHCMPDGSGKKHGRDEHVSDAGIVGVRAAKPTGARWYNHMSARNIRNELGSELWDRYFKFSIVRNPFDKLVSGFYMFDERQPSPTDPERSILEFRSWLRSLDDLVSRHRILIENDVVPHFRKPMECALIDRDKYLIDGDLCLDFLIRYENLEQGVREVCNLLEIEFDAARIPELKKGQRHQALRVSEYYDEECEAIARKFYQWELDHFGYDLS